MGALKNLLVNTFLKKLTDGDKGSTLLGAIAAALVCAKVDWSLVAQGLHDQPSAIECGKAAAVALLAVWGWFTGRKKAQS
jgi:hypothetical protein